MRPKSDNASIGLCGIEITGAAHGGHQRRFASIGLCGIEILKRRRLVVVLILASIGLCGIEMGLRKCGITAFGLPQSDCVELKWRESTGHANQRPASIGLCGIEIPFSGLDLYRMGSLNRTVWN